MTMPMREKRRQAADRGMCTTCCIREPSGDNKTCDICLEVAARTRPRPDTFCIECAASGFHRAGCPLKPQRGEG